MAEQTTYRFTLPGYPAVRLMVNRGGQFYGKGNFQKDGIDYKGWEHRFPREMTALEDLLASGLATFTRVDRPASKPVTGKPPVTATKPEPKPQTKDTVPHEQPKRKLTDFLPG